MTTTEIRAIPTTYRGTKFRSKLEASWAEWFDAQKIAWAYEPEGYILPDGTAYLPDFWLPTKHVLVEVKGIMRDGDEGKISQMRDAAEAKNIGFAVVGAVTSKDVDQIWTAADRRDYADFMTLMTLVQLDCGLRHGVAMPRHESDFPVWDEASSACEEYEGRLEAGETCAGRGVDDLLPYFRCRYGNRAELWRKDGSWRSCGIQIDRGSGGCAVRAASLRRIRVGWEQPAMGVRGDVAAYDKWQPWRWRSP